jgi:2,3-dihydroxyphenylpropionate 1,2-dioxygenase
MIVGSVCMSHSPIMDRNRATPAAEKGFWSAIEKAAEYVAEAEPDLVVVIQPGWFGSPPSFPTRSAAS